MRFADIPGHDDIKERLRHMADSGRLPHAILLEGPEGTAKFALARAFACYIHCENRHDGDSCGTCPACQQHAEFNHIDTFYSFPVKKKNSKTTISNDLFTDFKEFISDNPFMDIKLWAAKLDNTNTLPQIYVEEATELVRKLSFKTRRSRYKIVLMWLPERINESASNKLLKLIEEPFEDTIFIMTSDEPRLILPTIYSRTQRIEVPRYSDSEITDILTARGIAAEQAHQVARTADGSVNTALRLVNDAGSMAEFFSLFTSLMRSAYARRVADLRKWSNGIAEMSRDRQLQFVEYMARMIRESFITHLADERLLTTSPTEQAFLTKFHPFINHKNVEDFNRLLDNAARDLAANGNSKMIFFDLAVRSIILIRR